MNFKQLSYKTLIVGIITILYTLCVARVSTVTKVFAISDTHAPKVAWDRVAVAHSFLSDFRDKNTKVLFLGDIIDGTYVSTFAHDVEDYDTLDEFDAGNKLLDMFTPNVYMAGNHENRFYKPGNTKQGYRRLLDPRRWLDIKRRGIRWIPYSSHNPNVYRVGRLGFIHGFGAGQYAAAKVAARYGSCVFGHTHRVQMIVHPHVDGWPTAYNIGCMCKLDQKYAGYNDPQGWAHAFGYGYVYKSGRYSFNIVRFNGDRIHIEGKEYKI